MSSESRDPVGTKDARTEHDASRCVTLLTLILYIYPLGLLADLSSPSASTTLRTLSNNQSTMLKYMVRESLVLLKIDKKMDAPHTIMSLRLLSF